MRTTSTYAEDAYGARATLGRLERKIFLSDATHKMRKKKKKNYAQMRAKLVRFFSYGGFQALNRAVKYYSCILVQGKNIFFYGT